ncbi:MAG: hypothetical protein E5W75_28430, partial [Mesorhizobium sp.]
RRRAKAALEKLLTASEQIDAALSAAALEIYRNLYATADSTAQAAQLAASGAFATMPLSGVGLSPWRYMFDHARAYLASVTGIDHQHLPDQEGDRCMLCQEPMTADAAGRIQSFNDFVTGAANKAAQVASIAHEEALRQIKGLTIATGEAVEAALGEFG